MSASEPFLRARGVARQFGAQVALERTDIDICGREMLALIGANGAGKSTLLAVLAGALDPSEGRVERVNGGRVGWVPQRPALYDRLTARENLELFARLEGETDHAGVAAARSPPLLVAGLVGLVAGYGSSKPRVALVDEDRLPPVVTVGLGALFGGLPRVATRRLLA